MNLPVKQGHFDKTLRNVREKLASLGLNETLTYSLVNKQEADEFDTENFEKIKILAPLSVDKSYLRKSLITSLYKTYKFNKSHFQDDVNIFEIAKTFGKQDENYIEENKLAVLMSGNYFTGVKEYKTDFYIIKGIAEQVLDYLGYTGRYSFIVSDKLPKELHPGKSAFINLNGENIGIIGMLNPGFEKDEVYVLEINLSKLLEKKVSKMKYKEISKFPEVRKDISIIVDENIESEEIRREIKKAGGRILIDSKVFDVYQGKGIEQGKKAIAFSLKLGSNKETLTDEQINEELEKIEKGLEKKFGAILRS